MPGEGVPQGGSAAVMIVGGSTVGFDQGRCVITGIWFVGAGDTYVMSSFVGEIGTRMTARAVGLALEEGFAPPGCFGKFRQVWINFRSKRPHICEQVIDLRRIGRDVMADDTARFNAVSCIGPGGEAVVGRCMQQVDQADDLFALIDSIAQK